MDNSSRSPRRTRVFLLPAVLALPCVLAGTAQAATPAQPDGPGTVTAREASAPAGTDGPWFQRTTLDLGGDQIAYSRTLSGFDATGAYFRTQALHLGGAGGPRYEETASHS
ncbi:hypothetical protein [Streptomyces sp. NPDC088785]|uniref:hypothetical protein n=1 Tax=Streptomyces sp. NPDC088785 TaxID=3365897 RepID=UPI0038301F3A